MSARQKKKIPSGRPAKKAAEKFPATGDKRDAPHVGRAIKGCECMCCRAHRMLERQAKRDRIREVLAENEPMIPDSVVWHTHQ
jgi:hypothetical protein